MVAWDAARKYFSDGESCDFAILAAQNRELIAILAQAVELERFAFGDDLICVIRIDAPGGKKTLLTGIVASFGGMGRVDAAISARSILDEISTPWLILTGIAGGFEDIGVRLGDVLVASEIIDYESQRLTNELRPEYRLKRFRADAQLLEASRAVAASDWWSGDFPGRHVETHIGPVLSGDKVIADVGRIPEFRRLDEAAIGVEMEGGGVAAAASRSKDSSGFLMIRGVADLANKRKRADAADWLDFACEASAVFTFSVIREVWRV